MSEPISWIIDGVLGDFLEESCDPYTSRVTNTRTGKQKIFRGETAWSDASRYAWDEHNKPQNRQWKGWEAI